MKYQEELQEKLNNLFGDHPEGSEAKSFIHWFTIYTHQIDDIVDDGISEPETICEPFLIALNLFSSKFYRAHQDELYPVIRMIHHTWLDSVQMEDSTELWANEQADCLKSCAVEILLIVIEILGGYNLRRELSFSVRKNAYDVQHKENNLEQ